MSREIGIEASVFVAHRKRLFSSPNTLVFQSTSFHPHCKAFKYSLLDRSAGVGAMMSEVFVAVDTGGFDCGFLSVQVLT